MARHGMLKHLRAVNDRRAQSDREAMRVLRPDQRVYYAHCLRSWGAFDDAGFDVCWAGRNLEGRALRKTLENRP